MNSFGFNFGEFSNDLESTADGIFRRAVPPLCPECGVLMNRNGYNTYSKKYLGSIKMGRYLCPCCGKPLEEDRSFWEALKNSFFGVMNVFYQQLRFYNVAYQGISDVMKLVFPRGKTTIYNEFMESVEKTYIPPVEDVLIVHYDEQHLKIGGTQKFRLTLLDDATGRPIADELYDNKDSETIKAFLGEYLNPDSCIFIVTDLAPGYPGIFDELFGDNVVHQLCLLHLNKLIAGDFPRNATIRQELMKYRLLNIFYNRDAEIKMLEEMAAEEKRLIEQNDQKNYEAWLKEKIADFRIFLHDQELSRRRKEKNLEQRPYQEALEIFTALMAEIESFEESVQKRLKMIEKNWKGLTAFYFVEGAPATNNLVENYYGTSLKMHHKKQFRTENGLKNQIKLSSMKRAGILGKCKDTILSAFSRFIPFLSPG
ncbi:MAG TPA: transposase [Methanosarcinales archaeon]|nr:transposase [Methanosarcinales archaeon]